MTQCINHHVSITLAVLGASLKSYILCYKYLDGMMLFVK